VTNEQLEQLLNRLELHGLGRRLLIGMVEASPQALAGERGRISREALRQLADHDDEALVTGIDELFEFRSLPGQEDSFVLLINYYYHHEEPLVTFEIDPKALALYSSEPK
jgi:hypothetical protein